MKQFYDNTMLSDYKKCPRFFYLRHERGWRPKGTATALIFGLSWHAAMDILWRGAGKFPKEVLIDTAMAAWEEQWVAEGMKPIADLDLQDIEMLGARTPHTAREMLINYYEQREHFMTSCTLLSAEKPFAVPIYQDRDDVWYIGRRDKDIRMNGDNVVIEHKTTTEYKIDGGFKSQYLESWDPNSQCQGYLYAAKIELGECRYVFVDAALVHKKVHDKFRFIPISATFSNLDNWLWECRDWINRVQSERERLAGQPRDRVIMGAFPKNTESCVGKYGPCSFLSICRGFHNPELLEDAPEGFVRDPWHPFEVLKISELGMTET